VEHAITTDSRSKSCIDYNVTVTMWPSINEMTKQLVRKYGTMLDTVRRACPSCIHILKA
jgi:hypothetical protein